MAQKRKPPGFRTEQLAYWFFRFNGCMNIVNFLVHHERRGREGTDVDILAVRFPHRRELAMSNDPMDDHTIFDSKNKIDLIIAEIKTGRCALNGPWTDPEKQNMHRVLYAIGAFPEEMVSKVADGLYTQQYYEDVQYRMRLFAVGQEKNTTLPEKVAQLTWEEVLRFIYERLYRYRRIKSQHNQWDFYGRRLFNKMRSHRSVDSFVQDILPQIEG